MSQNASRDRRYAWRGFGLCNGRLRRSCGALLALMLSLLAVSSLEAATPPDTQITNTVKVSTDNVVSGDLSVSVSFTTAKRVPAAIRFLQQALSSGSSQSSVSLPTTYCRETGKAFEPIQLATPAKVSLRPPNAYLSGEVMFIEISDFDQNIDPLIKETVIVTVTSSSGDRERLRLTETDVSSGVFLGGIQTKKSPSVRGNCQLDVGSRDMLLIAYEDKYDPLDTVTENMLIDPFGKLFDSETGDLINNATVTLMDAGTQQQAVIYSPNGIDRWPATVVTGESVTDTAGVIFVTNPGEYRFPSVLAGDYYIVVSAPKNYRFPSTRSDSELQMLPGAPWVLGTGSRGRNFRVSAGPAVQLDIPLDPARGGLWLKKTASFSTASIGDFIQYQVEVKNANATAVRQVSIVDRLPRGFRYQADSLRVNKVKVGNPTIEGDGRTLNIVLDDMNPQQTLNISYVLEVTAGSPIGKAVNKVWSTTPNVSSNVAEAVIEVKQELFAEKSFLIGRVFVGACQPDKPEKDMREGVANVRLYLEDGSYVVTDEEGRWHMDDIEPGTHVLRLDEISLPNGFTINHCQKTARNHDGGGSRFVRLEPGSLWREDFHITIVEGSRQTGSIDTETEHFLSEEVSQRTPEYDSTWLEKEQGVEPLEILWPPARFTPAIKSIDIAVRHLGRQRLVLLMNGATISPLLYEGKIGSKKNKLAISLWKGVDIPDGTSEITAILMEEDGAEMARITRKAHFSGGPYKAEFIAEKSRLVADGKTPPLIAVRLTDKSGFHVRPGVVANFTVRAPYLPWGLNRDGGQLTGQDTRPIYRIKEDGIAYIPLKPTTDSGEVKITLPMSHNRSETINVWLEGDGRDWIMVGLARTGWNQEKIRHSTESMAADERDAWHRDDGRVAFFAKGRIKGEYLLTAAYDSAKKSSKTPDGFGSVIDPDKYYTLYGDNTERQFEASSSRKLFLKLEKKQFYALFGDYHTGLSKTDLANYNRTFNGFKMELKTDHLSLKLFASETALAHVRDEIPGNGTSGRYFLSRKNIVKNSDVVTLEVRDRYQTGRMISSTPLSRHVDYDLDADDGSLVFNQIVNVRDDYFNPVYIIVDYETEDDREEALVVGGRAAVSTADDRYELGSTYIEENNKGFEAKLYGIDATVRVNDALELRAEIARTDTAQDGIASAWQLEGELSDGAVTSEIYVRQTEAGYGGLGQQNASEVGTLKQGGRVVWQLTESIGLQANADRQQQLSSQRENRTVSTELVQSGSQHTARLGVRWAEDVSIEGDENLSELITGDLAWAITDKLTTSVGVELPFSGKDDSEARSSRYRAGADYALTQRINFFVEQEWTSGGEKAEKTRLGLRTTPWAGGQFDIGIDHTVNSDENSLAATSALMQKWQINEQWSADVSLEQGQSIRSSLTDFGSASTTDNDGEDFTTASLGLGWHDGGWAWSGLMEYRYATDDQVNVRTTLLKQLEKGSSVFGELQWRKTSTDASQSEENTLSLGYVNRTRQDIKLFHQLDYRYEHTRQESGNIRSRKLIANNHINYTGFESSQLALQYGGKYVSINVDGDEYSGYTDLMGLQFRHDLNEKWDLGVHGGVLNSWNSGNHSFSYGMSVGYSPINGVWLELGYNWKGFRDEDFRGSEYTSAGPWFGINMKFDETTIRRMTSKVSRQAILPVPVAPAHRQPAVPAELQVTGILSSAKPKVTLSPAAHLVASSSCRVVQLGSFNGIDNAQALLGRLVDIPAFIIGGQPEEEGSDRLYRVMSGPYDKQQVAATQKKLTEQGIAKVWVRNVPCHMLTSRVECHGYPY